MISSAIRILLIPFVSYGYAVLLLDLEVDAYSAGFKWDYLELNIFLTHVVVSYLTYLFAWIACAQQCWTFFVPMILSTPIAFVWYTGSVEVIEIFPFVDEYFTEWNLNYVVFIVASLLWMSQFLAFSYYLFQKSDNILTRDTDLFWMPRYNSIFLEQQLILNKKTVISGYDLELPKRTVHKKHFSTDNFIFICSTMYHETEEEMKQMLKSINRVAEAGINKQRHLNFESHIFFDDACNGKQLKQWTLQLLSLLEDTLEVNPDSNTKYITPYGIKFVYKIREKMDFYIHLKDNNKVKNKKRWSQVMYMEYVLNYRIKHSECIFKDKAFILTTDADIDFTNDSVLALLDILARDEGVGAVCARTHPLGSGPVVWYQIFDYAIGHWFQKAAEHILGCVLCCPGCFSVFRVKALENVLEDYSSSVRTGFQFLTKDMGEDRWLCTLLIKKGWRLEYSAVSQDRTYCPETFEEFYKQRRRWIPSTIANLALLIKDYSSITSNNNSITILFILYQFLIVFSSMISPATVILIIVTGIKALDHSVNDIALTIVLGIISVLYGVICIYATQKTQLGIAKILTLVFSIIMAVVISGILSDTIDSVITGDEGMNSEHTNHTSHHFRFPTDISAVYVGVFAVTFIIAGVLHFNEIFCLFHFIWYLLCLPSGYLFLMIYSVCNINNRSWGTREETRPKSKSNSGSWLDYFLGKWYSVLSFLNKCIRRKQNSQAEGSSQTEGLVQESFLESSLIDHSQFELDGDVEEWLREHQCHVSKTCIM